MSDLRATIAAVRDDGRNRQTRCPAHPDRNPSLSVRLKDNGYISVKCFTGCSEPAILEAAGLSLRDLAPAQDSAGRTVRRFEVRDLHGALVAVQERIDEPGRDKRCVWRQPDGTAGLQGRRAADLPLYNTHRLTEWAGQPVVITEGPPACDALTRRGIPAVATMTGASGTPSDAVLRPLLEHPTVLLWPDNDTPGAAHMDRITARLRALGHADVRLVEWSDAPPAGDAADYPGDPRPLIASAAPVASSPTPSDKAAAALPCHTPAEIAAMDTTAPCAIAPYLYRGSITEGTGYAKRGKTSFWLYNVGCAVYGVPSLGQPTHSTGAVWLTEERLTTFRAGLERAGLLAAPNLRIVSKWDIPASTTWPDVVASAAQLCRTSGSDLLVIDTLAGWAGFKGDEENNAGSALAALEPLQRAAAAGLAILVIRHDRKGGGAVGESGRGSSAFTGAVDTIVALKKLEGQAQTSRRVLEAISRFEGVPDELVIERQPLSYSHVPTGSGFWMNLYVPLGAPESVDASVAEAAILGAVEAASEPLTVEDLKARCQAVKPSTLSAALKALADTGRLVKAGAGRKGQPFTYQKAFGDSSRTPNPRVRGNTNPRIEVADGFGY